MRCLLFLAAILPAAALPSSQADVRISETTHLGRTHFRIETAFATFLYDTAGGGFSSILDPDGADWIAYRDEPWGEYPASAASAFRGLPNLVFGGEDSGAGHPGHARCRSTIVSDNRIHTTTLSGRWAWTWSFHENCAELIIEKSDPAHPYWFLYEGPAGGRWDPANTFWGSDQGGPDSAAPDFYAGDIRFGHFRWLYFGTKTSRHTLWIAQIEDDERLDLYALLGNEASGLHSPDGMIVAGFGRGPGNAPLLDRPLRFLIGLERQRIATPADHARLARRIEAVLDRAKTASLSLPAGKSTGDR